GTWCSGRWSCAWRLALNRCCPREQPLDVDIAPNALQLRHHARCRRAIRDGAARRRRLAIGGCRWRATYRPDERTQRRDVRHDFGGARWIVAAGAGRGGVLCRLERRVLVHTAYSGRAALLLRSKPTYVVVPGGAPRFPISRRSAE